MRTHIAAVAVAVAMAATVAGCSADPERPPSTSTATSESAPDEADITTVPEDKNAEAADSLSGELADWHYGSSMVWNNSGSYVVPGQPEMVASVLEDLQKDGASVEYAITQVGEGTGASLAFVGVVSVDSTDPLTPAEVVTYVGTINPTTGAETSRHEVHRGMDYTIGGSALDGDVRILGSGSVVAFTLYSASSTHNLGSRAVAFDVDKGEIAWEREASDVSFFPNSKFGLLREYADYDQSMFATSACATHSIVDLASGAPVVAADYVVAIDSTCTGPNLGGNSRFVTLGAVGTDGTSVDIITGSIGEPWNEGALMDNGVWLYDETSTLAAYGATETSSAGIPIKVVDMTSGAVVYEMPADTSAALSATIVNIFDGDLYLNTSNGNATLDLSNGETIDSGWEYVTLQRFDSGWTLDAGMNLHAPDGDKGKD